MWMSCLWVCLLISWDFDTEIAPGFTLNSEKNSEGLGQNVLMREDEREVRGERLDWIKLAGSLHQLKSWCLNRKSSWNKTSRTSNWVVDGLQQQKTTLSSSSVRQEQKFDAYDLTKLGQAKKGKRIIRSFSIGYWKPLPFCMNSSAYTRQNTQANTNHASSHWFCGVCMISCHTLS